MNKQEKEVVIIFLGACMVTIIFFILAWVDFGLTNNAKGDVMALVFGLYVVCVVLFGVYPTIGFYNKKEGSNE